MQVLVTNGLCDSPALSLFPLDYLVVTADIPLSIIEQSLVGVGHISLLGSE